jgi:HprK-related kinase A
MKLADLPVEELRRVLAEASLPLDFGFARVRIQSEVDALAPVLQLLYGEYPLKAPDGFFDVTARIGRVPGFRRYVHPQVTFVLDGETPFEPFPAETHLPLLEWGLNWSLGARCNHLLLLHAGVVERGGRAVLLPALPESGKSTLTAALTARGYRLLSDEFGAVRLSDGMMLPLVRPVALKNASIDVIRGFAPGAVIGPTFPKTRKGDVAHLAPSAESVGRRHQPAEPALIVFPKFTAGADTQLEPMLRSRAFVKLSANSFNYAVLGPDAFDAVGSLIDRCGCYRLIFSDLDSAIYEIGKLLDLHASGALPS